MKGEFPVTRDRTLINAIKIAYIVNCLLNLLYLFFSLKTIIKNELLLIFKIINANNQIS